MGFTTSALAANTFTAPLACTVAQTLNNAFLYTACETDPTCIKRDIAFRATSEICNRFCNYSINTTKNEFKLRCNFTACIFWNISFNRIFS